MIPQAIIFDFDGVLVDTEIIFQEVERDALSDMGIPHSLEEYQERFLGLNQSLWPEIVNPLLEAKKLPYLAPDFEKQLGRAFRKRMKGREIAMNGAYDLLAELKLPKAIGTSAPRASLDYKIGHTDFVKYFGENLVSSCADVQPKPAPDVPLAAANKLKVLPEHCLVIEDSPTGVRAARAAGIKVWGFLGGSHANDLVGATLLEHGAERIVNDMNDLGKAFAEMDLMK